MRTISLPSTQGPAGETIKIEEGGTGARSPEGAVLNLGAIPTSAIGAPGGIAGVGINNRLYPENIPKDTLATISVEGPVAVAAATRHTYKISNFDSFTDYTLESVNSMCYLDEDTIHFTAPQEVGYSGFVLNGMLFNVLVVAQHTAAPTLALAGSGYLSSNGVANLIASPFETTKIGAWHQSSDWHVATDPYFDNIVLRELNSSTNLTSIRLLQLELSLTYYVRVRYTDSQEEPSAWSNTVMFDTNSQAAFKEKRKFQETPPQDGARFAMGYDPTVLGGAGVAISASGRTLAISEPGWKTSFGVAQGRVYIHTSETEAWNLRQTITAPVRSGTQSVYGSSVALSADARYLAVADSGYAAPSNTKLGIVDIYRKTAAGDYVFMQSLRCDCDQPPSAMGNFGCSMLLSANGETLVISQTTSSWYGAIRYEGIVQIFKLVSGSYVLQQTLNASQYYVNDQYGAALSADATFTRIIVGKGREGYATNQPSNYRGEVYVNDPSGYTREAVIKAQNQSAYDTYGARVAISGDGLTILLASPAQTNLGNPANFASIKGQVAVFNRTGTTWAQVQSLATDSVNNQTYFGQACLLSADGTQCMISSSHDASIANLNSVGQINYFVKNAAGVWTQAGKILASDELTRTQAGAMYNNLGLHIVSTPMFDVNAVAGAAHLQGTLFAGACYLFSI